LSIQFSQGDEDNRLWALLLRQMVIRVNPVIVQEFPLSALETFQPKDAESTNECFSLEGRFPSNLARRATYISFVLKTD